MSVTSHLSKITEVGRGRAHNTEGEFQSPADPTGTVGKKTDLLLEDSLVPLFGNGQFKKCSMGIEDSVRKALNEGPNGTRLSCSPAPYITSQL